MCIGGDQAAIIPLVGVDSFVMCMARRRLSHRFLPSGTTLRLGRYNLWPRAAVILSNVVVIILKDDRG